MKVWISKYASSEVIFERETDPNYLWRPSGIYVRVDGLYGSYKLGRDAHTTREAAVAAAEAMRIKKIASLREQIAKLEKLTF